MSEMGRLEFGRLTEAWKGEASDFTPLLSERLDELGAAIGVDLASIGQAEVPTDGGRRIDIVAQGADGSELVVENQYGRGDHDHLTRGLAYAVARRARGLIVVAEEHRDEFRAVAQYLNELAEADRTRGVAVWLVEAQAVRIDGGRWAPLFSAVTEPNAFTIASQPVPGSLPTLDEFWDMFSSPDTLAVAKSVVERWMKLGYRPPARSEPRRPRSTRPVGCRCSNRDRDLLRRSRPRAIQFVRRPEQWNRYRTPDDGLLSRTSKLAVRLQRIGAPGEDIRGLAQLNDQRFALRVLV